MSWMYVSRFVSLQVVEFPHFVPPHHSFVATSRNLQAKQKKKTISGHENRTAWLGPMKNHHIWVWKAASILLPREFIAYYISHTTNESSGQKKQPIVCQMHDWNHLKAISYMSSFCCGHSKALIETCSVCSVQSDPRWSTGVQNHFSASQHLPARRLGCPTLWPEKLP